MDFAMSAKGQDYYDRLTDFMVEFVFPARPSSTCRRVGCYHTAKAPDEVVGDLPRNAMGKVVRNQLRFDGGR
jgi:hypothetical protein